MFAEKEGCCYSNWKIISYETLKTPFDEAVEITFVCCNEESIN